MSDKLEEARTELEKLEEMRVNNLQDARPIFSDLWVIGRCFGVKTVYPPQYQTNIKVLQDGNIYLITSIGSGEFDRHIGNFHVNHSIACHLNVTRFGKYSGYPLDGDLVCRMGYNVTTNEFIVGDGQFFVGGNWNKRLADKYLTKANQNKTDIALREIESQIDTLKNKLLIGKIV